MSTAMRAATTLKTLTVDDAWARVDAGAAFTDLRPIADYLDVHIPGSLALLYEFGPGMAVRARDCLPLDLPLILLSDATADMANAAAALRGKGFSVLGCVDDGLNAWAATRGAPASTDIVRGERPPTGTLLDVSDPGARAPEDAQRIPIETLWNRASEAGDADPVVIVAGYGVRAALAVGMLERAGRREIVVWDTRP
jgi:rhodanese-related sulfurtransferase